MAADSPGKTNTRTWMYSFDVCEVQQASPTEIYRWECILPLYWIWGCEKLGHPGRP